MRHGGFLPGVVAATGAARAQAPDRHVPGEPSEVDAARLDRVIEDVLHRPEFSWRFERPPAAELEDGSWWLSRFAVGLGDLMRRGWEALEEMMGALLRWLRELAERDTQPEVSLGGSVLNSGWLMVAALTAVGLGGLWLWWRWRSEVVREVEAEPVVLEEVAEDESAADKVPWQDWLDWARELEAQGKLRQAVRALYLAILSHLASHGVLQLARFKSNRDYLEELRRRTRAWPEVEGWFAGSMALFERVWYGREQPTTEQLSGIADNLERIQEHVATAP